MGVGGPLLTPAEFKVAAFIYRAIEQNGGSDVRMTAQELAEAAGVSERLVETARKTLAAKGIFRLEITPVGSWFGFPEASATSNASQPECPGTEAADQTAPASAAAQDSRPAPSAGLDIQAPATAPALRAAALVPTVPGSRPPEMAAEATAQEEALGPALGAPSATIASTAAVGSARTAEPDVAPELSAPVPHDLRSAHAPPALRAEALVPTVPGSRPPEMAAEATLQKAAPGPAIGMPAEPKVEPELSAESRRGTSKISGSPKLPNGRSRRTRIRFGTCAPADRDPSQYRG